MVNSDFIYLKGGDFVLKKATEYGAVEIWMNERVRRACANSCADFVYGFLEVHLLFCLIAIIMFIFRYCHTFGNCNLILRV